MHVHPRATDGNWRKLLAHAIRDPDELCDILDLPDAIRSAAHRAARDFPLVVPRHFIDLIERGNPDDPLLLQFLPLHAETTEHPDASPDPTLDASFCAAPGVLQKYEGRALLVTTQLCAIHCRYCFRRHFAYDTIPIGLDEWKNSLRFISDNPSINEVILSGGDPLCLSDGSLQRLFDHILEFPQVERVRIHTRMPVVLPARITAEFVELLVNRPFQTIVVIHANHPRELSTDCQSAIRKIRDSGAILLNQSVLLKGINDDVNTLARLSESLLQAGVLPYYIHQLDRVQGAMHFEVPVEQGLSLMEQLRKRLPGYAVPRYVQEQPGEPSKTALSS